MGRFSPNPVGGPLPFVLAAVLAALLAAAVHVPLLLLDDHVSALLVLIGIAGLLILGIVVRLLMGVMMRAALDSVVAVGILHPDLRCQHEPAITPNRTDPSARWV